MSCNNSTAPINIRPNKAKPCKLKCSYHFDYNNSSCNVTHKGEYLSIKYDAPTGTPPVEFNNIYYTVHEIRIYTPSLHKYNGRHADAEMIIVHTGNGKNLLVCLPILSSGDMSSSSSQFTTIINETKQRAPNTGESVSINMPNFNLNSFVPHDIPFYSYKGTIPYPPCNGSYDYVVFATTNYSVPIPRTALYTLQKLIKKNTISTKPKSDLYYNKHGNATNEGGSDDIYIECSPTGEDGRILYESKLNGDKTDDTMAGKHIDILAILDNPFVKVTIGVVLSLIVFKGGKFLLNKLKKAKTPPKE